MHFLRRTAQVVVAVGAIAAALVAAGPAGAAPVTHVVAQSGTSGSRPAGIPAGAVRAP